MKAIAYRLMIFVLGAAGTLSAASPAAAIIGGQADGTSDPYVGAVDIRLAGAPVVGSGVLISPTVFLTAGHVTHFFDRRGITRARVTFDAVVSESGTWYWGTVHTNPAYKDSLRDDPNDLGVVVLDDPVANIAPATLPTLKLLDALGAQTLLRHPLRTVGYGVSDFAGGPYTSGYPTPDFGSAGTRRNEAANFASITLGWLRLRQPDGNVCFGDSGGPSLLPNSDVVVGITISSADLALCSGSGAAQDMRLDTAAHRAFIGQFVTLP